MEGIDPLEFFGFNNVKMNLIESFFPRIKITTRGHLMHIKGEAKELKEFERKFATLLDHYFQFNKDVYKRQVKKGGKLQTCCTR